MVESLLMAVVVEPCSGVDSTGSQLVSVFQKVSRLILASFIYELAARVVGSMPRQGRGKSFGRDLIIQMVPVDVGGRGRAGSSCRGRTGLFR
jgi:hypothetical protein